jgi:transcriptional regulator with XRE-family HTH domain
MTTLTALGTVPEWTITDRLRKARELTGMDQTEFADALGVSRSTVSNYERGSRVYRRPVLLAWAMSSGVPLEWLHTGQQSAPQPGPVEGLDECAVRELNPQPADKAHGFGSYVAAIAPLRAA